MKETLDSKSRNDLVLYRIKRAEETLSEADCLAMNNHFSGAVNRLYYASYYIVSALLIANGIEASSHVGVRSMFGLKFVKTGKIDLSHGKFFNEIFELRHSNDYDDFVFCDKESFNQLRPQASSLISTIRELLM